MTLLAPITQNLTSKFQKGKSEVNGGRKAEQQTSPSIQKTSNQ